MSPAMVGEQWSKQPAIGYACILLGVNQARLSSITLGRAEDARLEAVIQRNLKALEEIICFNRRNNIRLFRISSDLIPLASHPAVDFPWREKFAEEFLKLAVLAKEGGLRLSMHPGQYTVLSSPEEAIRKRSIADLEYHADLLDALGADDSGRIILHLGGGYGDKPGAMRRFCQVVKDLSPKVFRRLSLENDERIYNIREVLDTAEKAGLPVIFDNLHHLLNHPGDNAGADNEWMRLAASTWSPSQGNPKMHYSQQAQGKRPGAHSLTICLAEFLRWYVENKVAELSIDVMLEVKDKNLSALKCIQALDQSLPDQWKDTSSQAELLALSRRAVPFGGQAGEAKMGAREFWTWVEKMLRQPAKKEGLLQVLAWVRANYMERLDNRQLAFLTKLADLLNGTDPPAKIEGKIAEFLQRFAVKESLDDLYAQLFISYNLLQKE